MDIALIGFGTVGQGLAAILQSRAAELRAAHGFMPRVVAVATGSNGTLYNPDGIDLDALLQAARNGSRPYLRDLPGQHDWDATRIARESRAAVLVEASPTNLTTGQPALDLCMTALNAGKHLVLANKGPIAVGYARLKDCADQFKRRLRFEATVMAGTPTLNLGTQALAGAGVRAVRGILNGTTNYILTQMEQGMEYAAALRRAQELGYAETDPSGDVEGWDAAGKLVILGAALFNRALTLDDIHVKGITRITSTDIRAARYEDERWKLIASITADGTARVEPVRLPVSDPLANVSGATNAITYSTDLMGDVTLVGAGAGQRETGYALLADLLEIHRLENGG